MKRVEGAQLEFRDFLELIPDATIATIPDGRIVLANEVATTLLGYSHEELIGMNVLDITPERFRPELLEDREAFFASPSRRTIGIDEQQYVMCADGSEIPVEITLSYVELPLGPVRVGAVRDISQRLEAEAERERLERQVKHDQEARLESIGQLAGGVAHDFNNLLSVIINYADFASSEIEDPDAVRHDVEQIKSSALRAAELTRQLLLFSRNTGDQRRPIHLNETLEDIGKLLRRVIGEHIELVVKLEPDLWLVEADPSQIEHVVINLAVNARDAMPRGGTLEIETSNVVIGEGYVSEHPEAPGPGPYVRLTIADSGAGMDRETMERAFEPFFTTKARADGTGLGLATVYGTIKNHGGNVFLYSEPGLGTTVKIHLPVTDRAIIEREESIERAITPGTGERVLVVEDDDAVRRMVVRALIGGGYRVIDLERGHDALQLLADPEQEFALLLTDVVMPEMQGGELAEKAIELRPDLPVLFMSGYSDLMLNKFDGTRGEIDVLEKPFTIYELLRNVQVMIARGPE